MAVQNVLTSSSTIVIRAVSYFFLRWPLAPIAFTAFAIYIPASISSFFHALQNGQEEVVTTQTARTLVHKEANGEVVEDIDVTDTQLIIEESGDISPWRTILAGVPNPSRLVLTLITFLINLSCVTMVADRLYSEHLTPTDGLAFVRPGFISEKQAKFLVREPDQSKMPVTFEIRVKDNQLPFKTEDFITAGGVLETSNDTDYTAVVDITVTHHPQLTYEWRTSNGFSGEFTSPPEAGRYPDKFDGKFTFLSTSCIVNRLPYNPLDHPLSIPGIRHLSNLLPDLGAQFMLFLGDFIYADVPRLWGQSADNYRQKYRAVYASPEWPSVGQNLSWIHVLDDHEIQNDWDGNTTGVYPAAVEPWHHYHTAVNPPSVRRPSSTSVSTGATWFEFAQGPASFFMADTRSYRSSNKIDYEDKDKTMLGAEQLADLIAFLQKPEPKGVDWKIIASSVPFTKNWPVNVQDTWGGFLVERKKILEAMWDVAARGIGVVVLSGDRHEFAATKFPPPENSTWTEGATVYEFSASPLSQFYSPIGTYRQVDDEDVQIKYINKGYSKFGAITIERIPESGKSSLSYRLFVDGVEAWNTTILSPDRTVQSKLWDRITGSR
ncbi:hypothetical protein N8I77_008975 [Diaporthe amygdali]|uniref:PhoD-like phosphatase metallophosphatase domain-containing protein n=1 Tax=Phomopsis amygdali TaxID=1214568 RepID=A0AAD9SA49_PHOAM|nr:hypothetical protein N8I77_008975 [Diaporthe amygdali]